MSKNLAFEKVRFLDELPPEEMRRMRKQRALAGVGYSLLAGTAFVLVSKTINALTYPSLPILIDWPATLLMWLWVLLGLSALGALVGWYAESIVAVFAGSLALAFTIVGYSIFQSGQFEAVTLIMFLMLMLPITAVCFPVALIVRWLINRHMYALDEPDKKRKRMIASTVAIALLLGIIPGLLTRMNSSGAQSAVALVEMLEDASQNPGTDTRLSREKTAGLKEHIGMDYQLEIRRSLFSTVGYDILIVFSDGYEVTCTLVTYNKENPYLRKCYPGAFPETER